MVVYLDLAFLLNGGADALALYVTAKLSGLHIPARRLLLAAALGGGYGALCLLPPLAGLGWGPLQLLTALGLVALAFGRRGPLLRLGLLFFLLSCTMGGALLAAVQLLREGGALAALARLNWGVFFLGGGGCYVLLSLVFRGGARHALAGQLLPVSVTVGERRAKFTALLDTGHTLHDPVTGAPVLIAQAAALADLWTAEQRGKLSTLAETGAAQCLAALGEPGRWRLLPYRAVGVSGGLLLCFRADGVQVDGRDLGPLTVALSPTPVSDGGGYTALWGGAGEEADHAA